MTQWWRDMRRRVGIRYGKRRMGRKFEEDAYFFGMKIYVPKTLHTIMQAFRVARGIPIARLITIAIYNELKRDKPFDLKLKPDTAFIPGKYSEQASTVFKFLQLNGGGMALDLLVLSREMIDIQDENTILHAVRELKELDLIEEISTTEFAKVPWVQIRRYKNL